MLKSSTWGWILPKTGATSLFGLSLTIWFMLAGLFLLWLFYRYQQRLERTGKEPLIAPSLLKNRQLTGGLVSFLFMFLIQSGVFFIVPLFLSVVIGLSPIATGVRLLPLSLSLLLAAVGIPRLRPHADPRRVVRVGLLALIAGIVVLIASLEQGADASIVIVPLLIVGFGIGALASQLGAVTVSAVPTEKSPEVGGLQNTATQLGASLGTALAGSILIAALTASFLDRHPEQPERAAAGEVAGQHEPRRGRALHLRQRRAGAACQGGPHAARSDQRCAVKQNDASQIDGLRAALSVLAVMGVIALFFTGRIPTLKQPGATPGPDPPEAPPERT